MTTQLVAGFQAKARAVADARASSLLAAFLTACGSGSSGTDGSGAFEPASEPGDAGELVVEAVPSPSSPGGRTPYLASAPDGRVWMSWIEPSGDDGHSLRVSSWLDPAEAGAGRRDASGWSTPMEVVRSTELFVNWADFSLVLAGPAGRLWVHWLERGGSHVYDYHVKLTSSGDGGATWSPPLTLHDDLSPTEHGFVSAVALRGHPEGSPTEGVAGFAWLDGRRMAVDEGGAPADPEMTIRFRRVRASGTLADDPLLPEPEDLLDSRTCECCQTDMAQTPEGLVVAYRNRDEDEYRDINLVRQTGGRWEEPRPVHEDGWRFEGCPVNGPSVATSAGRTAVLWFTAPEGRPQVRLASSEDSGRSFSPPTRVDGGDPVGRVELVGGSDGSFLAIWIERTSSGEGELRARLVGTDDRLGPTTALSSVSGGRASGFPRAALAADGSVLAAWADPDGTGSVRVARISYGASRAGRPTRAEDAEGSPTQDDEGG